MNLDIDKNELIEHAHIILNSDMTGKELAKLMKMNTRQFYNYRNGSMDVSKARLETLIKFEKLYKEIEEKTERNKRYGKI